ncbi:nicotinamide riboside transporter PnuC [Herbaspirillum seropedicae]|uniref:nicotinamide riboside transporter PnuC n=1 Tax=Herbaspirillum seropedicae TaxID=964 RepID=UPI0028554A3E|nr:nicotinamide riboside transporter PnuC [Herbaspirillum seropedicae]MDR6393846.1 nicotinamide mononucleotide transporter [Herbaspirillum seropedicae]
MSPDTPLSLLGLSTTPLELVSFALAVITVWLNIRQNHWAWLFSILSSVLYAAVFADARLYGDAGLQFVFVAVSIWGWYQWLRGGVAHQPLAVSRLQRGGWGLMLAAWLAGWWVLSWFLQRYTDTDVPHMDGFLTAGSLVGQFLLSRKKIENWLVWIAVDVLYVGLYVYKHLSLTAMLYALFVLMAAAGWRSWRRAAAQAGRPA